MYGYIYLTINLINGMIYVGQHKAEKFSTIYKGSGKLITEAFKKYGKENFKVELLEWCETPEEANEKERYWEKYFGLPNFEIGYNITHGGQDKSFLHCHHTEETKLNLSRKKTGTKLSEESCILISLHKTGKPQSREASEKRSKTLREKYAKEKEEGIIRPAYHLGSKDSEETKLKKSLAHRDKKPSLETRQKMSQSHLGSKHKPHKNTITLKGLKDQRKIKMN